jgi:hypothetical protein
LGRVNAEKGLLAPRPAVLKLFRSAMTCFEAISESLVWNVCE